MHMRQTRPNKQHVERIEGICLPYCFLHRSTECVSIKVIPHFYLPFFFIR